ncbi:MAG TPA: hypothetical protein PKX12_11000 [Spirochaetota bacterium]|nr:hypothetical protein [Spirochaetota bacterium]
MYGTAQSFTISGESGATIEYSINNGSTWQDYTGPIDLNIVPDTIFTYQVLARQTDVLGNGPTETSTSIDVTIDDEPPAAPVISGLSSGTYGTTQVFTISGESGASIEYSLDNGSTWQDYTGPANLDVVSGVTFTYHVLARQSDSFGNGPTQTSTSINVAIDDEPPAAPVISGLSNGTRCTDQYFTVSGEELAPLEYTIDGGSTWQSYSGIVIISIPNRYQKTFSIQARQTDQYGNGPTCSLTYSITIDKIKPDKPTITSNNLTAYEDTTPTFYWASNNGNGTFRYRLDNPDLSSQSETSTTSYTPGSALNLGRHVLYVQERDKAGNWSRSARITAEIYEPNACYYVDSVNGLDTNACNIDVMPCQTIQAAITKAGTPTGPWKRCIKVTTPGTTSLSVSAADPLDVPSGLSIYGGYNENFTSRAGRNKIYYTGTSDSSIVVNIEQGTRSGDYPTVIDGFIINPGNPGSGKTRCGIYVNADSVNQTDVCIRNCEFQHETDAGRDQYATNIYVADGGHVYIDSCIAGSSGVTGNPPLDYTCISIPHKTVSKIVDSSFIVQPEYSDVNYIGIRIYSGSNYAGTSEIIIDGCDMEQGNIRNFSGIAMEKAPHTTIKNSYIKGNGTTTVRGIDIQSLESGSELKIYNNVIETINGEYGLSVTGDTASDIYIRNNHVGGDTVSGSYGILVDVNSGDIYVQNNFIEGFNTGIDLSNVTRLDNNNVVHASTAYCYNGSSYTYSTINNESWADGNIFENYHSYLDSASYYHYLFSSYYTQFLSLDFEISGLNGLHSNQAWDNEYSTDRDDYTRTPPDDSLSTGWSIGPYEY